uniref:Prostate stem cell antigen n=1 Tax=Pogona vitticeps TaxID=103695 RepID=A0A6J0V5J9_9SAUR
MMPLLIFVLAGNVFIQSTGSIKCYTCNTQLDNGNCNKQVDCNQGAKACKTDVVGVVGLFNVITKECASECNPYFKDFTVGKRNISCCYTDLCNVNGTHAFRMNSVYVALAVLASFACVFLGNRL